MVSPQQHQLDDGDLSRNRIIMSNLKDSVLSRLNPDHDHSQIHRQLQNLFPSLDTPTHPPYALMIRRAITEMNNHRIGSSEEAISEFVQREYQDLPWAHLKILNFHLRKLCQSGEVVYTKAGRYILKEQQEEEQHPCKGSARKKRTKRRVLENGTGGDRVLEVESTQEKGEQQCVVEEKPSQFSLTGSNEPQESHIHQVSSILYAQGSPECMITTDVDVVDLGLVSKTTPSLTRVSVHDHDDEDKVPQHYNKGNLDENPMSGTGCLELEKKLPKRPRGRPRKADVANYREESLLDIIHDEHELFTNNSRMQFGQGQSRGKGRGRPSKVIQDTEQCAGEQLILQDQAKLSGRGRGSA